MPYYKVLFKILLHKTRNEFATLQWTWIYKTFAGFIDFICEWKLAKPWNCFLNHPINHVNYHNMLVITSTMLLQKEFTFQLNPNIKQLYLIADIKHNCNMLQYAMIPAVNAI